MNKPQPNDDGLSLIELIVYIVVLGILMAGITTIFVNTWQAQASVTSQTQATTRGQLVSSQIERAMRNAVDFRVLDSGATLEVNTSFTGDRQCQGFALTGAGLTMTVSSNTTELAAGAWPVWQERVESVAGVPLFTGIDTTGVAYAFNATSDSAPVRFTGDTYTRNQTLGTMDGCWE